MIKPIINEITHMHNNIFNIVIILYLEQEKIEINTGRFSPSPLEIVIYLFFSD